MLFLFLRELRHMGEKIFDQWMLKVLLWIPLMAKSVYSPMKEQSNGSHWSSAFQLIQPWCESGAKICRLWTLTIRSERLVTFSCRSLLLFLIHPCNWLLTGVFPWIVTSGVTLNHYVQHVHRVACDNIFPYQLGWISMRQGVSFTHIL